jgi:hypothetical protein
MRFFELSNRTWINFHQVTSLTQANGKTTISLSDGDKIVEDDANYIEMLWDEVKANQTEPRA